MNSIVNARQNTAAGRRVAILLCAVMLVAIFFRFYRLTELPPGFHGDEAMDALKASEVLRTGDVGAFYKIRSLAEIFPGEEANASNALSEEFIGSAHARFMHETFGSEGLFATLTALAMAVLGKAPWIIRSVAAFFGSLTVLGLFFLGRELFGLYDSGKKLSPDKARPDWASIAALVSAYFLAVSFWHVNFSRMGFRSILMPLFTAFALYFLIKALWRTNRVRDYMIAGIFLGLGFHTYIAYRVMPIVAVAAFALKLMETGRNERSEQKNLLRGAVALSALAVIFALPLIYYYALNPGDFLYRMATMSTGREGESGAESRLLAIPYAMFKTLGQFNFIGDGNLRHNYIGSPHLLWPIGIFFLVGICAAIKGAAVFCKNLFSKSAPSRALSIRVFLLIWFFVSLSPSFLSAGPHPHAIRSFNAILPALIFSAHGATLVYFFILSNVKTAVTKRAVAGAAFLILVAIGVAEYKKYFVDWASHPEIGLAFHEPHVKVSAFMESLPDEYKKFVVVNFRPETVMYLTDSYDDESRRKKNIVYLMPKRKVDIDFMKERPYAVFPLDYDRALMEQLKKNVPGRFVEADGFEYVISE